MDNKIRTKVKFEISRIDNFLNEAKPLINLCLTQEPGFIEITSAATVLHSFYNGIESIGVMLLKSINEKIPDHGQWHKALFGLLFGTNSLGINIIRNDLRTLLSMYLDFRHIIRHAYGPEYDWDIMEILVTNLLTTWEKVKADFEIFIENN